MYLCHLVKHKRKILLPTSYLFCNRLSCPRTKLHWHIPYNRLCAPISPKLIYISCCICVKRRRVFETFYGLRATCFFVTDYHVLEPNYTGTCNKNWYVIKCICVCPGICHTTDCLNLSRPNYLHILLCLCQCRRVFEQFYGLRATCFFVTDYHVLETNFTGTCNKIWCVIRCICVCVFLP